MMKQTDLSRVDLNLLVLFEVVLEERHVGRAAARLNLSPSAISHALSRLRRLLNDPVFLRTPKGVVPTARALEIAGPVAEVLGRARAVVATAEPFDPARSTRRFTIGAPDGVSAVLLPPLLAVLGRDAPGIDLSVRQVLPAPGDISPARAWRNVFVELDERALDIAVIPYGEIPSRYAARVLYEEEFVIVMRCGHPLAAEPTLERYAGVSHLVVSLSGDPYGFVDEVLAELGIERRIALTVPNFAMALGVLATTDLVSALPKRFVALQGGRAELVAIEPPFRLPTFALNAVVPKAALGDGGVAWMFESLGALVAAPLRPPGPDGRGGSS